MAAAGGGALLAWLLTRAPELRGWRLSQLLLVPGAFVLACWVLRQTGGRPDMGAGIILIVIIVLTAFLLAPNIAFYCGAGLSNFLDPMDWTPAEEIALRPIRRLIDRDQYYQALGDLDALLKKHKPTYESLLLHAKLLHHFGRVDETVAALLQTIALCQSTAQQLTVLELLAVLEERHQSPRKPLAPGTRPIQIYHRLVLFPIAAQDRLLHKEIPAGVYEVEETFHRNHRWLKLAGEDWGNAAMCWEAVLQIHPPDPAPPQKGFLWQMARINQAITLALKGKRRLQSQAEAGQLLKQAGQFIRREDWRSALPLLQKASACDPDNYEIAYRWVQAVRHIADDRATARAVNTVLSQSQWSADEQEMLRQLQHPIAPKK